MSTTLEHQLAHALALRIIDEYIGDSKTGSHEKSAEALREFERQREQELMDRNRVHY